MAERIDVRGWLVAEVDPGPRLFGGADGGRLFLFHRPGSPVAWTLLQVSHRTTWDADSGRPSDGQAYVWADTYTSLAELGAGMERDWSSEAWRELVRVGAENPPHDPELRALWTPVRIDLDLEQSSVRRPDYGARGAGRGAPGWEADALALAVNRLAELGFVVLERTPTASDLFPSHLIKGWSNHVVGALKAAAHGHSIRLIVAVDGFGEIYTRSGDSTYRPGARRRYPPRPLTEREARVVEQVYERRRDALRRSEEER